MRASIDALKRQRKPGSIGPFGFRSEPTVRHAPWEAEHEHRNQHDHDSQNDYNQVCEDQYAK